MDIVMRILAGLAVLGAAFLLVLKLAMWMYAVDWDGKKSWDDADTGTHEEYMGNAFCTIFASWATRRNQCSEATLTPGGVSPEAAISAPEAEPSPRSTA